MRIEEEPSSLVDSKEDSYNIPASQKEDPIDILSKNESGDNLSKDNIGVKSRDEELSLKNYNLEALEVSSGKFKAAHGLKYPEHMNFLQVLWNKAGPLVESMKIMLDPMKNEFVGEIAGLQADMSNIPQQLVDFLIEEVGKDPFNAINFTNKIIDQLEEYKEEESAGDHQGDPDAHPPDKGNSNAKPVRLRDHCSEPHGQIPQKGPPQPPTYWRMETRRKLNSWIWHPVDNTKRPSAMTAGHRGKTTNTAASTTSAPRRRGAKKQATTHRED